MRPDPRRETTGTGQGAVRQWPPGADGGRPEW